MIAGAVVAIACLWLGICLGYWAARKDLSKRHGLPVQGPAPERATPTPVQAAVPVATTPEARRGAMVARLRQALSVDADEGGDVEVAPAADALASLLSDILGHYAATVEPEHQACADVRRVTDYIFNQAMRVAERGRAATLASSARPGVHLGRVH